MDIGTNRAAEILGVSQSTVQKMCREGRFKTATQDGAGKPWHILAEEVYQLVEARNERREV